jgi:hypothetical protein
MSEPSAPSSAPEAPPLALEGAPDALRLLAPAEIRARRRPGAVLLFFAWQLAWALVVATPVHAWAGRAFGSHPDGDAALFEPGGRALLFWLSSGDSALPVTTRTTLLLLVLGAILGQLPLGFLTASLALGRGDPGRAPRGAAFGMGATLFLPFTGLVVAVGLAQLLVLGLFTFGGSALDSATAARLGDGPAFVLRLGAYAIGGAIAALLSVAADLARAAITLDLALRDARKAAWSSMVHGLRAAFTLPAREKGRALGAWAWRWAAGIVLVLLGALAASALGGEGGSALAALWLVHQGVVLGRTALRASWLARALRLVPRRADQRDSVR